MSSPSSELTPEQRALFARRLAEAGLDSHVPRGITPRVASAGPAPVSYAQQQLWFLEHLHGRTSHYHIPSCLRLRGPLAFEPFVSAVNAIVRRHEVLRTAIRASADGRPVQVSEPELTLPVELVDVRDEAHALALAAERYRQPFDLRQAPLLRVTLFRLAPDHHVLLVVTHHGVCDGWSMSVFYRELAAFYDAFSDERSSAPSADASALSQAAGLPDLAIQYADYAQWQRERMSGDDLRADAAFWTRYLSGAPGRLELPIDAAREALPTFRGAVLSRAIPQELHRSLQAVAERHDVTLFMTLLAVFAVWLRRQTGESDIVIGSPVAGRDRVELEPLIGSFASMLPLRMRVPEDISVADLLEDVRERVLEAFAHQELPFEQIVDAAQARRRTDTSPLFQVVFNLIRFEEDIRLKGLTIDELRITELDAKFDLTLYAIQTDGGLRLDLTYNRDLFTAARMEEMLAQMERLLTQIGADASRPVAAIALHPVDGGFDDHDEAHDEAHDKARLPNPRTPLVRVPFEAVPSRLDAAGGDRRRFEIRDARGDRSADDVEARSGQISAWLRDEGVVRGDVVAIWASRRADLVPAILGCWNAGAAFVLLDPAYPPARLCGYLDVVSPKAWIAIDEATLISVEVAARLAAIPCVPAPAHAADTLSAAAGAATRPAPSRTTLDPRDTAYIVFTSGTTGAPNAVESPHDALSHFVDWHCATFGLTMVDRFSLLSGLSHDPLLRDIVTPLWLGATLCVPEPDCLQLPDRLRAWLRAERVTVMHATPALLELLTAGAQDGPLTDLRYAFSGGDRLTQAIVDRVTALAPNVTVVNFYGTSETPQAMGYHVAARPKATRLNATMELTRQPIVPIGRGIDGAQLLVVTEAGQMAGVGELGQIYVRTPYLAKGYAGSEERTQRAFITNPFTGAEHDRVYRTGDLGRYLPDGTVAFHGRADSQIKVRGFRVETEEIERMALEHAAVRQAVACLKADASGEPLLALFVAGVPAADRAEAVREIRAHLAERLPSPMVPAVIVALDELPRTPNHKVDVRRLLLPDVDATGPATVDGGASTVASAMLGGLEAEMARLWRSLLPGAQIGPRDNFFDVGGNSLLLLRLHQLLQATFTWTTVPLIDLFRHPTVSAMARRVAADRGDSGEPVANGPRASEANRASAYATGHAGGESNDIAIIGLAGRFPGAADVDEFWRNIRDGVESIRFYSDEELRARGVASATLADPAFVRAGAALDDLDLFDAGFFGFTPREAEVTDPQHRLFLECAWQALENAGYAPHDASRRIGVFGGASANTYLLGHLLRNPKRLDEGGGFNASVLHGNEKDYLPSRVAYKLGLRGPSMAVQTACSTSLVAVTRACQSLLSGECDMALAGGVAANVWQELGYLHEQDSILSPDGHCRTFDARGQGTIFGSGVGIVVLKRLSQAVADGDAIAAVIKGFALNNDGAARIGFTAPGVDGQAAVIREALANAGVEPDTVAYVEAHGTGTSLGDPIELEALTRAFRERTRDVQFCAIGSVKTNVGHLNAAAGIAGLIKAALAVRDAQLPPSLHFDQPNPRIDFAASPFFVNTALRSWEGRGPRRAGVSSFGIGGTNVHVVLEQAPEQPVSTASRPMQILAQSARTPNALRDAAARLATHLESGHVAEADLADAAYTLAVGRQTFEHRAAVVGANVEEAAAALRKGDWAPALIGRRGAVRGSASDGVAMLLSGQGSQFVGMGRDLYARERVFRDEIDRAGAFLQPILGVDLREVMHTGPDALLRQTWVTQPALYVLTRALMKQWADWGVRPVALLGHSLGELAAATAAGVWDEESALRLVAARGRLMWATEPGVMLGVLMNEDTAGRYVDETVAIAAVNGGRQVVFSGAASAMTTLRATLEADGLPVRTLAVERAFHSPTMEPVRAAYLEQLRGMRLRRPALRFLSNVTGGWATEAVCEPDYWWRQMREPVRFAEGLRELARTHGGPWLEVGPGDALCRLARAELRGSQPRPLILPSLVEPKHAADGGRERSAADERHGIERTLAALWSAGVAVDWNGYYRDERRRRVALPTYPFERQRHWIDPEPVDEVATAHASARHQDDGVSKEPDLTNWFYVPSWRRSSPLTARASARLRRTSPDREAPGAATARASFSTPLVLLEAETSAAAHREGDHEGEPASCPGTRPATASETRLESVATPEGARAAGLALVERLRSEGHRPVIVRPGERFAQGGEDDYQVDPRDPEHYVRLIAELARDGRAPDAIFHLWLLPPSDSERADDEAVERAQAYGFHSLVHLAQALRGRAAALLVVASGLHELNADDVVSPEKATAIGPCRVIPQEQDTLAVRCVDVAAHDLAHGDHAGLAAALVTEMREIGGTAQAGRPGRLGHAVVEPLIAYRHGYRWIQTFEPAPLEAAPTAGVRDDGVYLLTGGLGGIALAVATHFARQARVKLALVSRAAFPAREGWDDVTARAGRPDAFSPAEERAAPALEKTARQIASLRALEALGAEVIVLQADVTDRSQLTAAIAQVRATFGAINGVVHAAGVAGGGLVELKTAAMARRVLAPKIAGTRLLAELLAGESLDFLVLCSSRAAVLGGVGQVDYCAANNFLDAFAHRQTRETGVQTMAIGWAAWQTVGMAATTPDLARRTDPTLGLTPAEGVESLDRILAAGLTQVIVSPQPLARLAEGGVLGLPSKTLSSETSLRNTSQPNASPQALSADPIGRTKRVLPSAVMELDASVGSSHATASPLEAAIGAIWERLLGIHPIGTQDDFLELGGHSLLGTQIMSQIRAALHVDLGLRDLFERPTIAGLAALVDERMRAARADASPLSPWPHIAKAGPAAGAVTSTPAELPLSWAQHGLWLHDQMRGASAVYNISSAIRLSGVLQPQALERALAEIARRHASLRTTFHERGGAPFQRIAPPQSSDHRLSTLDLTHLRGEERERAVARATDEEAQRPCDLSTGPLFRSRLIRVQPHEHVLQLTMHHIVSDGWSVGVLLREFAACYDAFAGGRTPALPELPLQYGDYVAWLHDPESSARLASQRDYWRTQLQQAPVLLDLSTDRPRPSPRGDGGSTEFALLAPELLSSLQALGRESGATLFMVLLAAFDTLLSLYTGQRDIIVGSPSAGRGRTELEALIGFFANMLALRTDLRGDPTFRALVARVRDVCLAAYANQDVAFDQLLDDLRIERSARHAPLVQVVFVLQNAARQTLALDGLDAELLPIESRTTKFDLTVTMQESAEGLKTWVEYSTELFDRATVRRMLGHLETLLTNAVAEPDRPISRLAMADADERRALIAAASGRSSSLPSLPSVPNTAARSLLAPLSLPASLSEWFESQAERRTNAFAVIYEGEQLTYGELNRRANRLAHELLARGTRRGDLIGIRLERSPAVVVSILAVLKAGAAYVPMDPTYPAERLRFVLHDARMAVLITDGGAVGDSATAKRSSGHRSAEDGAAEDRVPVVRLDDEADAASIASRDSGNPARSGGDAASAVAYVIYTSGSTGVPKGVPVTHLNVMRLLRETEPQFGFGPDDVWTLFHSFGFDFSVWEMWGALLYGGRLVIVPYLVSRTPDAFRALLASERVTVLNQTPSAFRQLVAIEAADESAASGQAPLHLRYVIFGGEALDLQALRPWVARHGDAQPQLVNMYGITETTVHVTYRRIRAADIDAGAASVIGVPIADLQLHVLDEQMEPASIGCPGEIYVGGAGVACGYLHRADLTAERFVPDPFGTIAGARLYRSGDVGRRLSHDDVEYVGRADQQVKIRGFRIEPGEIERVLTEHPSVREARVIARTDAAGEKQLVAYLVRAPLAVAAGETDAEAARVATPFDAAALRAFLGEQLPEYMIPAAFVPLDRVPLTAHGKLDLAALPDPSRAPQGGRAADDASQPTTETEQALAEIWSGVLDIERPDIDTSFFVLGGDSIHSIRVRAMATARGLPFTLQQLFQHQTIRALAGALAPAAPAPAVAATSLLPESDRAALPAGVEDAYPLTMLQAGMVFHSEMNRSSSVYHDVFSYRIEAAFDLERLRRAVSLVMARHALLRTSFDLKTYSVPMQLVQRELPPPIAYEDGGALSEAEQEAAIGRWLDAERVRPFAWDIAPLFRLLVYRLGVERFQFTLSFHHAMLDGWSVASLMTELFQAYMAPDAADAALALPPLASSFRDFVMLEQAALSSPDTQAFWRERLADAAVTKLARRSDEGEAKVASGVRSHRVTLSAALSAGLHDAARRIGVPVKSVLLAAHMRVLGRATGASDVIGGLVTNGRPEEADGERILGLFLNTVPLRLRLRGDTWAQLVRATFAEETALLSHRRFPLAAMPRAEASDGGAPLFDTVFNFIHFHVYDGLDRLPGLDVSSVRVFEQTNFPFVANFSIAGPSSALHLNLIHDPAAIAEARVADIAGYYVRALDAIVQRPQGRYDADDLLSESERAQLVMRWNDTAWIPRESDGGADGDAGGEPDGARAGETVHGLVARQAVQRPEAIALEGPGRRVTYAQLDRQAERIARYLRAQGIAPEALVGVCVRSGVEMAIAALGVMKAGGAYVPIDVAYPAERRAAMVASARASVVITDEMMASLLNASHDEERDECDEERDEERDAARAADEPASARAQAQAQETRAVVRGQLAYAIYTSGSTGVPKGVAVTHHSLLNLVTWHQREYLVTPSDRASQVASLGFDASVWEIWPYLTAGASVHVPDADTRMSPRDLVQWLARQRITLCFLPTPLAEAVLDEERVEDLRDLRALLTGGDRLRRGARMSLLFKVMNHYGPTENAVVATWTEVAPESAAPPIGRPLSNVRAYVLDEACLPTPAGVAGELYLGGESLARGYVGDAAQTADRFVPDALSGEAGRRLYRTGDMARWLPDGRLDFLGRGDEQIKLRGHRIELGEIEAVLTKSTLVSSVAVSLRTDDAGDALLVAYIVARRAEEPQVEEQLRRHLAAELPAYMMPSVFMFLAEMPLTVHGKVDRKRLPPPPDRAASARGRDTATLSTDLQRQIAAIWSDVLGTPVLDLTDNFFVLGGDSLKAMRCIARVNDALHCSLPLRLLFDTPELEAFAIALVEAQTQGASEAELEALLAELGGLSDDDASARLAGLAGDVANA